MSRETVCPAESGWPLRSSAFALTVEPPTTTTPVFVDRAVIATSLAGVEVAVSGTAVPAAVTVLRPSVREPAGFPSSPTVLCPQRLDVVGLDGLLALLAGNGQAPLLGELRQLGDGARLERAG